MTDYHNSQRPSAEVIPFPCHHKHRPSSPQPTHSTRVVDRRESVTVYYCFAAYLDCLIVTGTHPDGYIERNGFFEVRVFRNDGTSELQEFYFPPKFQIPQLEPGIIYEFSVAEGPHPETGEPVLKLCYNHPIIRHV